MDNVSSSKSGTNLTILRIGPVKYIRENAGMLITLVALSLFFTITSENFMTGSNVLNVLRQISMNAIIAFGMTYVILLGGIDLSVGSIVAVAQTVTVGLMIAGVWLPLAVVLGVVAGALIGLTNGMIIAAIKVPPFITTLAMMTIARGIAYVYTGGRPMRFDNDNFYALGNGYIGVLPVPVIIMVICLLITSYVLNRTRFGRHVYAIGGNREAAKFSGIATKKVEVIVYSLSGLLAGLSGVILAARMSSAQPISGKGFELDAIAAVVLGGSSLAGGFGAIGGTIIGALVIGILNNGLNLIQVPFYWQEIIKGVVIILAVTVDMLRKNGKSLSVLKLLKVK